MEALSIFSHSHRGGYSASTHFDPDASPSRASTRRKGRGHRSRVSGTFIEGARRNPNSRSGFSSTFANLCPSQPNMTSFAASFALALALEEEGAVGREGSIPTEETTDKAAILEVESMRCGKKKVARGKGRINVRALARRLWECRTADDVDKVFDEMPEPPPPRVYSTIIRGLGVDKKLESALALVEWLKRKGKATGAAVGPNLFIYNSLLGALKQNRRFEDVDRVMEDMAAEGILPSVVTYNVLMSIYIEQGRPGVALDVLDRIEKEGLVPLSATYSIALFAYWKMGDPRGALAFYVELREKCVTGEVCQGTDENWEQELAKMKDYTIRVCYKVMREWLVGGGNRTSDIMKLLAAMDRVKVSPGRTEYERLMWACTEEGHFHVTKELYGRLRDLDCGISLSVCNHAIWLMGKARKWWAALEVYEDLLNKGPKPNNLSYELIMSHFNVLLGAARRKGIWRWGVRLIDKMQEKGLKPGSREWNAVLVACSKASEASTAVQIFRRMIEQGEKPNILSYGALLSALEKGKLYDEALQVWDHMCNVGIKPNSHVYTILITVYIGKGELEKVDSIIREMDSSGIAPNLITFNAVISGCARSNLPGAAFEWYHRMKVRNIAPNEITYEMLIQSLARDAKPKLAYEMYIRALNEGLELSSRTYDLVLESCKHYGASIDPSYIRPRALEKRKTINTRTFSVSCNFADTSIRGKPFYRETIYMH